MKTIGKQRAIASNAGFHGIPLFSFEVLFDLEQIDLVQSVRKDK
jgi:hypothetical protein